MPLPPVIRLILPALLLGLGAVPAAAQQAENPPPAVESASAPPVADESHIAPISLAARVGEYELAHQRLDALGSTRLRAKGNAALAMEYARDADFAAADKLLEEAKLLGDRGNLLTSDRVSVLLYIARKELEVERYAGDAEATFDMALAHLQNITGLGLDLALVETAFASLEIFGDRQQTYELVSLISDEKMRSKLIDSLRLSDLAGQGG